MLRPIRLPLTPPRRLLATLLAGLLATGSLAACGGGMGRDDAGTGQGTGADYAPLVEESRTLLDSELRAVALPEELAQRVGAVNVADVFPEGEVAAMLSTAHLNPAGTPTTPAPSGAYGDAAEAVAGAEVLTHHCLAGADGTRTVPVALTPEGALLATHTRMAPPGELLAAEPYSMLLVGPGDEWRELPGVTDLAEPGMQAVRASVNEEYAAWIQAPDTDLYTLTWQLIVADLDGGGARILADAQQLLGIEGALPAFSQWNTPVITEDAVYQATTLPFDDGPWIQDEDGSAWIGGLVAAPVDGGEPKVIAAGTRLAATDGAQVVHLVDGPQTAPSGQKPDEAGDDAPHRFALVAQTLGKDGEAWVTGELPADSTITDVALSEDLLVWVVSNFASETATLLVLDRESGVLRSVELGDLLAHPSVVGRRVGWGNWSGNNDAGEYLWEIPAPSSPMGVTAPRDDAAFGLIRLGENPGGARVRIAGREGEFISVTGTVGDPATGPSALPNWIGDAGGAESDGAPMGTLVDVVFRLD